MTTTADVVGDHHPDTTQSDECSGEVFANGAGRFHRAWTALERINPHRVALMIIRLPRDDERAAESTLNSAGWSQRCSLPDTPFFAAKNEVRLVFSKKTHAAWPYDLNWDIARSVMSILDDQKIRYQSLIIDVSKGIPPSDLYWWPFDVGAYLRNRRNPAIESGDEAKSTAARATSTTTDSAIKPTSPPEPNSAVRRMLAETMFYSKSNDAVIAELEWEDYTEFMGIEGLGLRKRKIGKPTHTTPRLIILRMLATLLAITVGVGVAYLRRTHIPIANSEFFPLAVTSAVVGLGSTLMWWAHASVLKSTAWKAQEKDPDSLRRRGLHFPYLWRLTETDLDIASSDRPGIRRANKTGSTLIFLALMGGAFAYGIGRFPADRSGAWIAGVTASAAGLAATGFVWRNFARLNIRIITIALSTTAILIPAGLFIIRSIYNQFYSRLGIYSDVDISQVALLRLGWPLTVHMTATAAVSGIMWIALYRHRFAQPNNWLLAMLFIVASMLPIAEAVDNASAAGDQVRQGQPVSGAIYSPTMVCVRPIGHEPISIEYHGRPLLAAGQTAHLWKIGTAGTQTLLMDRDAAKAAAGRVEGGKPQAPHVAPIQFVPSSSISVQLCDDSGPR